MRAFPTQLRHLTTILALLAVLALGWTTPTLAQPSEAPEAPTPPIDQDAVEVPPVADESCEVAPVEVVEQAPVAPEVVVPVQEPAQDGPTIELDLDDGPERCNYQQ